MRRRVGSEKLFRNRFGWIEWETENGIGIEDIDKSAEEIKQKLIHLMDR
jgi:hypothetical protein